MESLLQKIGLSKGEVSVYIILLRTGPSTVNIIHEKVGIERRNIYDILNKLIERGLVTYIDENKHRTFQASDPKNVLAYVEEKENNLAKLKQSVKDALPQLKSLSSDSTPKMNAQVFRGSEGMKTVWNDMLNEKEIRWLGSGNYVPDKFPAFYSQWTRRRIEAKVKSYHLFRYEIRGKVADKKLQFYKFLPKEFSGNPVVTVVYGDKVAQLMLGDDFFAFVVESKELAQNQKAYHLFLWQSVAKNEKK